ncbi:MAG: hypothetical protein FJ109_11625 [Deltaproteobacteria bacterium]|nr:hypothetical protein [Deltaproteobacteria bacterium]
MEQERETARDLEQRGVAPARVHDWLTSTGRVESFLSPESRPVKCVECPLLADGGPGAREMLVAFDYRSPFSLNLATHLDALLSARSSSIPLTVRLLPWVPGGEENRTLAAILVCASRTAPTSVARFHSRLVELHRTDRNREASLLLETLNPTPEETDCRRSAETQRFLQALVDHADHLSVRGTPVVFLDGREVCSQTGLDEDVLRAAARQAEAAAP